MLYYIVKFRYKYRSNKRWSKWQTWHGEETYITRDEAILEANKALAYHKYNAQLNTIASAIQYEVVQIETTTLDTTEVEL